MCQEGAQAPCCTRDEGGPFGAALQGEASNSHKLLRLQGCGGERYGKGATVIASCVDWRDERKRTLDDASKHFPTTPKPGSTPCSGIKAWKTPAYCPCGVRCRGGVTPIWAFVRNLRTWTAMPREKTQVEKPRGRKDPMRRPGADSSVVAVTWGNAHRAKGGGHPRRNQRANGRPEEPIGFDGRRQPSVGGTSRMNREVHVRFCERLGVKFPGPTRP